MSVVSTRRERWSGVVWAKGQCQLLVLGVGPVRGLGQCMRNEKKSELYLCTTSGSLSSLSSFGPTKSDAG